eukprot:TRINITY_DN2436_c0_g1_i1.p1 TRINITY_DN2436_c0_g1~~TRINITY_DN2436_c0_g1_i1.p1  ORF type:complete len:667 (-),score=79.98 TRINITY_DN2436_c0_g1_i1:247-2247(-)
MSSDLIFLSRSSTTQLLTLSALCLLLLFQSPVRAQVLDQSDDNLYLTHILQDRVGEGACVLLLDEEKKFGCLGPSQYEKRTGPLLLIDNEESLTDLFKPDLSIYEQSFVLLNSSLFTKEVVRMFKNINSTKVIGILVFGSLPPKTGFSPDDPYPQKKYGLHPKSSLIWNPLGSSLAYGLSNISLWALDAVASQKFLQKGLENRKKGNSGYPRYVVSPSGTMSAASSANAIECLQSSKPTCQPLGGLSVWSTFGSLPQKTKKKKTMMITSALDSSSFFHDFVPGGNAPISALVTLLATAEALSRSPDVAKSDKQVIFAFFGSESWGYSGSSRFAEDLHNFTCRHTSFVDDVEVGKNLSYCRNPWRISLDFSNLNLEDLELMVDVTQIGAASSLYVHQEGKGGEELVSAFLNMSGSASVKRATQSELPPSSLMSFLRVKPNLVGVALADHDAQYSNRYYHSRHDGRENVDSKQVSQVASVLSRVIFNHFLSLSTPPPAINNSLVDTLLNCFISNFTCTFLDRFFGSISRTQRSSISLYTSVYSPGRYFPAFNRNSASSRYVSAPVSSVVRSLLQSFNMTSRFHDALSPAVMYFTQDDSSSALTRTVAKDLAAKFGVFAESDWDKLELTGFYEDNPNKDIIMFVVGILSLFFCFGSLWVSIRYLQKKLI